MALETGNYVGDLVVTNPVAGDLKSAGDDHLRLIKTAVKTCFAGFTGSIILTGSDTGGVNNYALTPSPALPAYVTGMMVLMTPSATNTTTSTLNISALGAKTIKSVDGVALNASDFVAGTYYLMVYNGTDFRILFITKNYADNLSFSSSLPSQTGNGGKYITTDGTTASWADPFASTTLTGTPVAPTAAVDTSTTQLATTAFVINQAYAKLASPALTGTPTAPTGAADITTSQIINAAWYAGQAGTATPIVNGSGTAGTSKKWSPIDHVHPTQYAIATQAEMEADGSTTTIVSPGRVRYNPGVAKAWCKAGTTGNNVASYGMTSVTDVGVGDITFNFLTAFSSVQYGAVISITIGTSAATSCFFYSFATTSASCRCFTHTSDSEEALTDPGSWQFAAFGDH